MSAVLADNVVERHEELMKLVEAGLRRLCAERGEDWDTLPEEEREAFVDDLIHEDRT